MAGELDLDAFLSDDDVIPPDGDDTIPLRTVDDILNSPSSSASDSESESGTAFKTTKVQVVPQSSLPAPEKIETRQGTVTPPVNTLRNRSTSLDFPSSSSASSSSDTLTSLVLRGLSDRPLRPLFRGVRVSNPRPGAALAAAAAASRSVATPHAAAIKLRRVDPASGSLGKKNSGGVEEDVKKVEIEREHDASSNTSGITDKLEEFSVSENVNENLVNKSKGDNLELIAESKDEETIARSSENVTEDVEILNDNEILDHLQLNGNSGFQEIKEEKVREFVNNSELVDNPELVAELCTDHCELNLKEVESKPTERNQIPESLDNISPIDDEPEPPTSPTENLNEVDNLTQNDETSETRVDDLIEKAVEIAKKAEKKLKSSMKPLEYYEELEKRQASYGLHHEEGVVAQPMRLEGIRRGPPAVGYLQIDLDNAATRLVSSQGCTREHGSPQVVTVHRAYIAFGMSRGSVFVIPSKYSIHSSDNMDSKVCMSGIGTVTIQKTVYWYYV